MPIADKTLILEGQQDFSGGMDSSLAPTLIGNNAVATAVNITFRGGRPGTRPGFRQVSLSSGTNDGLNSYTNGYFQGAHFYFERRNDYNSAIIAVCGGKVVRVDLATYVVDGLYPLVSPSDFIFGKTYTIASIGTTDFTLVGASSNTIGLSFVATGVGTGNGSAYDVAPPFDPFDPCYFTQAERYLVIQNGKGTPLIWDGSNLYYSGLGPAESAGAVAQLHTIGAGTIMAYGQGRLFVASSDRTEITAGDIVYGGSTEQVSIVSGVASGGSYQITTSTNHGFSNGDRVTITGHSSEFGINGTWEIKNASGTTFEIEFSDTAAKGLGGFAAKANAGSESDLLRFTETTYLSEGGALQVPAFMGKITAMIFMPIQDTSTGQGDLLVFCEKGTASFAVSVPRNKWKDTAAFQRVVFQNIGATSHRSVVTDNGDVFFRSLDGLRSYRNARAEITSFGQVPISAEMNSVLSFDTKSMLGDVSSILFDNRLLFTASPTINYSGLPSDDGKKQPITFSKIVALDFTTLATVGAKRSASYDGVWGGLDVLQLVSGNVKGTPQAFAFAYDYTNNRVNVLWKLTENAPFDYPQNVPAQRINSIIETRAYDFGSASEQKRMIRADFWLSNILGQVDVNVYWRPDQYPCWRTWHSFSRCAEVDNCINPGVTMVDGENGVTTMCFSSDSPASFYYRLGKDKTFTGLLQYVYSEDAAGQALDLKNALIAAGFPVVFTARYGDFPNYCFVISTVALPNWEDYTPSPEGFWENLGNWEFPFMSVGSYAPLGLTFVPAKSAAGADCLSEFTLKNLQPQYRPQIRMPTPPEDTDPIISRPYIFGNDFQLRLEFTGHFQLNRILMLGQRILEQYQGTDTLEVL